MYRYLAADLGRIVANRFTLCRVSPSPANYSGFFPPPACPFFVPGMLTSSTNGIRPATYRKVSPRSIARTLNLAWIPREEFAANDDTGRWNSGAGDRTINRPIPDFRRRARKGMFGHAWLRAAETVAVENKRSPPLLLPSSPPLSPSIESSICILGSVNSFDLSRSFFFSPSSSSASYVTRQMAPITVSRMI